MRRGRCWFGFWGRFGSCFRCRPTQAAQERCEVVVFVPVRNNEDAFIIGVLFLYLIDFAGTGEPEVAVFGASECLSRPAEEGTKIRIGQAGAKADEEQAMG